LVSDCRSHQSAAVRWEDKIELAMHTGNVGSPFRKRLALVANSHPDTMLVNELFIGDHNKIRSTCHELGLEHKGGFQQHRCYMTFQQQCRYKYLLNSASIGYAACVQLIATCSPRIDPECLPHQVREQVQVPAALRLGRDLRAGRHDAQGVL
jgi:hypothetical protein